MKLKKGDKVRRYYDDSIGVVLRVYGLYAKVEFIHCQLMLPIGDLEKINGNN